MKDNAMKKNKKILTPPTQPKLIKCPKQLSSPEYIGSIKNDMLYAIDLKDIAYTHHYDNRTINLYKKHAEDRVVRYEKEMKQYKIDMKKYAIDYKKYQLKYNNYMIEVYKRSNKEIEDQLKNKQ